MSQELPPLIPLLPVDENHSWRSIPQREGRVVFLLAKNTLPIAATRFVTYFSDIAVYTWVASRAGSSFLAETVIPLSYIDASYWVISALFALGINIVKNRVINNDSGIAEYFYAGIGLGIVIPVILTLPGWIAVSTALKLSSNATWFGSFLTIDVMLRNIEMHSRQVMIGTGYRLGYLDGSHISLLTGVVKAGTFFGLSSYFVPKDLFNGFMGSRVAASILKMGGDGTFLFLSGRVFWRPKWRNIAADMKNILANGWQMSTQIFVELTVVGSLNIYISVSKNLLKLIAFRIAGTLDGAFAPWTSAWVRGVQRMIGEEQSENIRLTKRAFAITAVSAFIPVALYVVSPRTFLSIFTADQNILDAGETIVRLFSSGQFFYVLYAFFQSMLWMLFKDSGFSMGVSVAAALLNFAITLPLVLTGTGDFDLIMGVYVIYTFLGFTALTGRYGNRVAQEESTDAENAGIFGFFRREHVERIEHTRIAEEERDVELRFD